MVVTRCPFVSKDLANCRTDMVLLYSVASNRSWEGLNFCLWKIPPTFHEKLPINKNSYETKNLENTLTKGKKSKERKAKHNIFFLSFSPVYLFAFMFYWILISLRGISLKWYSHFIWMFTVICKLVDEQ